jgi:DNA repair exonuclease SbcCD ATPase subunit
VKRLAAKPFGTDWEEQYVEVFALAKRLRRQHAALRGAVKRSTKNKDRTQDKLDRIDSILEETLRQLRSLDNLIRWGRDDLVPACSRRFSDFEHAGLDVETESWERQQEDVLHDLQWLHLLEEVTPVDVPREWVDRQISQYQKKTAKRNSELTQELAKAKSEIRRLESETRGLKTKLSNAKERASKARAKARLAADQLQELLVKQDAAAGRETVIQHLREQVERLEREVLYEQARARQPGNYEIVRNECERLTRVVQDLTRERASLRLTIRKLGDENERLEDHIENLARQDL